MGQSSSQSWDLPLNLNPSCGTQQGQRAEPGGTKGSPVCLDTYPLAKGWSAQKALCSPKLDNRAENAPSSWGMWLLSRFISLLSQASACMCKSKTKIQLSANTGSSVMQLELASWLSKNLNWSLCLAQTTTQCSLVKLWKEKTPKESWHEPLSG